MSVARYDSVADFYLAEVGESVSDPGTAGLLEIVGEVGGARLLDLACGQGRVSRVLARRGAGVTGIDLSAVLIEKAREAERETPLGISYLVGDAAAAATIAPGPFTHVVCNYGMSDIDDLGGAIDAVAGVLTAGGSFVFSILHPCFPGWKQNAASSWPPGRGYFQEGWWRTDAPASRIRRSVGANHRTVSTYLNELAARGFVVERALEPPPPHQWLQADPSEQPVPTFFVLRCRKPAPPSLPSLDR